ncbi:hypothetical protein BZZ01_11450 [Nostocales cyanobacterium HT-58-2]|nr:hypothetical protein BZZ01_11450 [Nostocales cyanobacterium HT-58-2]
MTTQTISNPPTATGVNSVRPYTNEKSKLITPEKPLLIPPLVAAEIGLEAAIILQQIHYFSLNSKHILDDGRRWFYLTLEGWAEKLPFLKMSTIRRAIDKLKQLSLINVYRHSQHTWYQANWYTIHLENVKALWDRICQNQQIDVCNCDTSICSERANHIKEFSSEDFSTQQHAAADKDFLEENSQTNPLDVAVSEQTIDTSQKEAEEQGAGSRGEKELTSIDSSSPFLPAPKRSVLPASSGTRFVEEQSYSCSSIRTLTHEGFSSAAVDEPVEKPSQQDIQEICNQLRQIPCTPAFRVNQEIMTVVKKFWQNVPGALAYLKEALHTWKRVDSPEAVFVAACKNGKKPENWKKALPNCPQPSDEDLAQLAEAKSTGRIKDYYRQPDGLWVVDTGSQCVNFCNFLSIYWQQ